jgi:hypothetical protein
MTIVCMRADQAVRVAAGSTMQHSCSQCGCRVALAPSGQRLVAEEKADLLCLTCFGDSVSSAPEPPEVGLAATPEEFAKELRGAVPNTWRERN